MEWMACIDLPAFCLQLLLRREQSWRQFPAAVVESDKPLALLLHVNEHARRKGILPGMRYSAALSLSGALRAAPISAEQTERGLEEVVRLLGRFTPEVEPSRDDPGLFWVNATGLEGLFDSLDKWAGLIQDALREKEFEASVVVGFSRFLTSAVAKARRGVTVLADRALEEAAARRVPLDRLSLHPPTREILKKLGVRTLGAFADLPPEGIAKRFGKEVKLLHRLARGEMHESFRPIELEEPPRKRLILDYAEKDIARLIFLIARHLDPLLRELAGRGQALCEVELEFRLDRKGTLAECVRPAAPTLDAPQLVDLIYLRLQSALREDRVVELTLTARGVKATRAQLELFAERARRDLAAADRALARVRAEFGDKVVVRARLREGHLPEARFVFEPFGRMKKSVSCDARPPRAGAPPRGAGLVRRILLRPLPLPAGPRHTPSGWMLRSLGRGPIVRVLGPYIVSGGWWQRAVHREYHFAETKEGELLWVYYDRGRRRWFMQGRVE